MNDKFHYVCRRMSTNQFNQISRCLKDIYVPINEMCFHHSHQNLIQFNRWIDQNIIDTELITTKQFTNEYK